MFPTQKQQKQTNINLTKMDNIRNKQIEWD